MQIRKALEISCQGNFSPSPPVGKIQIVKFWLHVEIWQFQSGISWESFLGQPGIVDKGGMSNTASE